MKKVRMQMQYKYTAVIVPLESHLYLKYIAM